LAFDHVFVVGLEEGVFPHSRSLETVEDMEEERRLMYVAITRARQTVCLSYARYRMIAGVTQRQQPSRFLRELPAGCTEQSSAWGDDGGDGGHVAEHRPVWAAADHDTDPYADDDTE